MAASDVTPLLVELENMVVKPRIGVGNNDCFPEKIIKVVCESRIFLNKNMITLNVKSHIQQFRRVTHKCTIE